MDFFQQNNVNALCRTCLQTLAENGLSADVESNKHDIFLTPDLAKKLIICTSLSVEPTDGYPKNLCHSCFKKLNEFYKFQTMCVESAQRFGAMLETLMPYEDEKPEFNLQAQAKEEITVNEPDVLSAAEPLEETGIELVKTDVEPQKKRRGRRKRINDPEASVPDPVKGRRTRNCTAVKAENTEEATQSTNDKLEFASEALVVLEGFAQRDFSDDCSEFRPNSDEDFELPKLKKTKKMQKNKSGKQTNSDDLKRRHRKKGAPQAKVYHCDTCDARFYVEHRLQAHKRKHDGLMPYPCPQEGCERAFNRKHCLGVHMKEHDGTSQMHRCQEDGCSKQYRHKATLAMHMRKYHKVGPELKIHVCEVCGKVFKTSAVLNDHRYVHRDKSELPFPCDQPDCKRRFVNKDKLKVHLMRHAGIKNHVCPYCGMRKTTRHELKVHINYHTLERTWPCRFCTHVCNSAGNLKMHVRTMHERARDYACRYCDRSFAKPDTRKYHEMTHTGEKPNECKECGKCFTQPAALRTHQKIHLRDRAKGQTVIISTAEGVNLQTQAPSDAVLGRASNNDTNVNSLLSKSGSI